MSAVLTALASSRFTWLQLTRVALASAAIVASVIGPVAGEYLRVPAALYLILTTALEWHRRRSRQSAVGAGMWLLAADVVLVRAVTASGQDPLGPFGFLSFVHVLSVMMLLPHRIGLSVAFLHGVLAFVFTSLRVAGVFGAPISTSELGDLSVAIAGLLLVALATSLFSRQAQNQRDRSRRQVDGLAQLAEVLQDEDDIDVITSGLQDRVAALGYRRVAVVLDPDVAPTVRRVAALVADVHATHPELSGALEADDSNVVIVGLESGGDRLGVAVFVRGGTATQSIPGETVRLTERYAATVGAAIHRARLQAEITRLATVDGLTGLANRRVFDGAMADRVAAARRYGSTFSLLVLDIDKFKAVNDTHGHAVGDQVLSHVGRVLQANVRDTDLPARFGGEEFVVLLPETGARQAREVAEKLRRQLGDGSGPIPFTVSIGVATHSEDLATGEQLFQAADAALYRAKQGGRDRVEAAAVDV